MTSKQKAAGNRQSLRAMATRIRYMSRSWAGEDDQIAKHLDRLAKVIDVSTDKIRKKES